MENDYISIQDYGRLPPVGQCSPDILKKVAIGDLRTILAEYVLPEQPQQAIIEELERREPGSPKNFQKVTNEDLKTFLAKYSLSEQSRKAIIQEMERRKMSSSLYSMKLTEASTADDKKYPALGFIAGALIFFGIIILVAGVIFLIYCLNKEMIMIGFLSLPIALLSSLLFFAGAELIIVITDISSSAYKILKEISNR